MRSILIFLIAISLLKGGEPMTEADSALSGLHWLGHDSFRYETGGKVIYIDPWQVKGGPPADLILVTHGHGDHCDPESIAQIRGDNTVIIASATAAAVLDDPSVVKVRPGEVLQRSGVVIETVAAYNLNKFRSPGVPFHPRKDENVGFIIEYDGVRIYHAGDTDNIPEMKNILCTTALLPVSGIYVMTAEEAVLAASVISAQRYVPMHIGRHIGTMQDAETFKKCVGEKAVILRMEK